MIEIDLPVEVPQFREMQRTAHRRCLVRIVGQNLHATGDADVAHRAGAPTHMTPREDMMAASVMFHLAGVDKRAFMKGIEADPQTYKDWGGGGEWKIETSGKEDDLFSPFIKKPFDQAIKEGLIPAHLNTISGT
ncbi:MAG: hypothetical protein AAFQ81_03655, partial [Pseudomonadota bacterium]